MTASTAAARTRSRVDRRTLVGVVLLLVIVVACVVAPLASPYTPEAGVAPALEAPSGSHWFGTDQLGRDVFTRTFAAGLLDLGLALVGVSIPLVVGTVLGALFGSTRSPVLDWISHVIIDGINAFPFLVLMIAVVAMVGPGVQGLIIGLALTNWARYAKVARTRAISVRDSHYIEAASILGYGRWRILSRHLVPNVSSETTAYGFSDFIVVILTIAGLSFLGLGVRPPTPEWGAMIADGRVFLRQAWWITVAPGFMLSMTAVAVAIIGQGLGSRFAGQERSL